jgi:predicted permease
MALLAGAGFFIKSLVNVSRVELGLETENLVTFRVSPSLNGYEAEESMALFIELEEELAATPGVTGVSGAMVPILAGSSWGQDVAVEGFESGPDVDANSRYNEVGPDYFNTLGIPLLAGREFTPSDGEGAPQVSIINEAFAEKFGLDPRTAVGRWMSTDRYAEDLDIQIVGVVQDTKYNQVKEAAPPMFFTPYRQNDGLGFLTFYLRTQADPSPILRAIPDLVNRKDPNLPVDELRTMEDQIRENVSLDRMISVLATAFAVVATILAAIGLYGVLAYSVTQRTREIGLRMALGAGGTSVRKMVLGQVGKMTLIGGVIGILGAVALGRGAQSLLYELEGHDPLVMVSAAALLVLVALGAGYLPALRASRVDPMKALRYE